MHQQVNTKNVFYERHSISKTQKSGSLNSHHLALDYTFRTKQGDKQINKKEVNVPSLAHCSLLSPPLLLFLSLSLFSITAVIAF